MQVATLFRESATLLGAQMMESPSSCSSSSSAISSIASANGTMSHTSEHSSSSTINLGPLPVDNSQDKQQQLPAGLSNQNLNIINGLHNEKGSHEQQQPHPQQHQQQQQEPNPHQHHLHNHHLLSNMNNIHDRSNLDQHPPQHMQQHPHQQQQQHQQPTQQQHTNYRSVLDFIGETKKPDLYHPHQNGPHFLDHHKLRNFEEEDDRNYKM
jgi:hypothetical protein